VNLPLALLTDADRFPFADAERARLAAAGVALDCLDGHDPAELAERGPDVAALFVYHAQVDAPLVAALSGCRIVVRCGSGYDNIDVAAARAAGIEVAYVPDYGIDEVADHAFALLLACSRQVPLSDRRLRAGEWLPADALAPMRRLRGATLGLLGFGRIAQAVARRAVGFGMEVLATDPRGTVPDDLPVTLVDEATLLASADVLSLHLPLTPATRGLLGAERLAALKPGAILVNTSRGEIVDEAALLAALDAGTLAAAGLDVFEHEPLEAGDPLLARDDVVVTPHSAAFSQDALAELGRRAVDEAIRVLGGTAARHPVPA
jgi:D-3-phosphoglycerate dehydrogenase / 2-oxoglutarate reductase